MNLALGAKREVLHLVVQSRKKIISGHLEYPPPQESHFAN